MSHEIRTPINTILGMNEIIRRECKDENIISYADNIQEAGNRLLRTITDILDYTKIESGKIEILDEEYSMSALIGDLHNFICPQAREKGLKVSFEIDPEIPQKLYGDMHKIKRVITNLFSNAVKFTEKGSIIFRISVIDREEKHARLRFIVIDTGIGIKKEDKEKLFQAFNRLETNRNCSIEGAGMGLTLASNILQIMGTKLYVDSAYNTGSTFHFDIIQKIADSTPVGTSWNG